MRSLRAGGTNPNGPRVIQVGPLDLQQDFKIYPEAMSTLALDDIDKQQAVKQIWAIAQTNPRLFNVRKAAELLCSTFRGHSGDELLIPADKMQPPLPPLKLNVAFDKLRAGLQNAILQKYGIQVPMDQNLAAEASSGENLKDAVKSLNELQDPENPLEFILSGGESSTADED